MIRCPNLEKDDKFFWETYVPYMDVDSLISGDRDFRTPEEESHYIDGRTWFDRAQYILFGGDLIKTNADGYISIFHI